MRSSVSIIAVALVAAVATAGPAYGDIIQLKDGQTISGSLLRQGDHITITADDGRTFVVPPGDISKVTLTSTVTPAQAAESEWTRDAAAIKQASDLQTIISLHQKFLQKYPNQPISKEVAASLREYMTLARQDGVKFRGRWMPHAQVEVTRQQWADRAKPALDLYKGNNLRGALDAARSALREDPVNPDALTLAGLAAYRLNTLTVARDYFTTLASNDPTNVLAENNLAVILFQQHRAPESLTWYARALQASPENRFVADNIEEAFHAYTGSTDIAPYQDLTRLFAQSEPRIEGQMARHGLYRYGSTWVPLPILDRLKANIQAIKNAMAQLDAQYQAAKTNAGAMDAAIARADADYNATSANINYLNYVIATSYGDVSVYISQRDALIAELQRIEANRAALLAQKQSAVATASGAPDQADRLKAALAAAQAGQFTGTQRILDWGEADNPPPPSIVSLPSPVPVSIPTPVAVPASPEPDEATQSLLTSGYDQAMTPMGLIGIPIPIGFGGGGGGGGGHHGHPHDHDHDHDHGDGGDHGNGHHPHDHPGDNGPGGFPPNGTGLPVVDSPVPPINSPIAPINSPVAPIGSPVAPIGSPGGPFGSPHTPRGNGGGFHPVNTPQAPAITPALPTFTGNSPSSPQQDHAFAPISGPGGLSTGNAGSSSSDQSQNQKGH